VEQKNYPTDDQARSEIIEIGRRMYGKNFVAANDGNISCRVGPDTIWATPTGVSKGCMEINQLVKLRLNGEILQSGELGVSSEIKMHLRLYNENPAINAVTHAHPPAATAFAIAGRPLDRAVYPEALVNLGVVPCVHYEAPGSTGIPDSVAPYCRDYNALLLANHGALTWGSTLTEAFFRLESLEHYALILLYTGYIIGEANTLSGDQVDELVRIRERLGIFTGGLPSRVAARPGNRTDKVRSPTRGGAHHSPRRWSTRPYHKKT
jgi:L-fuculose-phosphate aldolase